MTVIPKPLVKGPFDMEPFAEYREKLSRDFDKIPDIVIETWIYRHWQEFQSWLRLKPLDWDYCFASLSSVEILEISHVGDWPETLKYWGDDLLGGNFRRDTWLGSYMLDQGTTPAPMIVAKNAGRVLHPREFGFLMCEPYQIIEGHMRLAYLQALIRHNYSKVPAEHVVCLVTLPTTLNSSVI